MNWDLVHSRQAKVKILSLRAIRQLQLSLTAMELVLTGMAHIRVGWAKASTYSRRESVNRCTHFMTEGSEDLLLRRNCVISCINMKYLTGYS